MRILSLIYLILGTLGFIGFLAHFNRWGSPFNYLMLITFPFYIASLSFTILIHPAACTVVAIKKMNRKEKERTPLIHAIWSSSIAAGFLSMIFNGYIISV
jgi:hypothetical protein